MGPQVAANSYRQESPYQQQQQQQQFAKPYPPLPAQQAAEYQAPPRWFNASLPQQQQPISQGYEANAPRLSSHSGLSNGSNDRRRGYNQQQAAPMYPDSMRFDDPYPAGGGPDGVPFVSVTSPSASKSLKQNKKQAVKLQPADKSGQQPPPVMMPKYQSAPPVERSPTGSQGSSASIAKASVGSASTLQARIDALRSDDGDNMVHSRISVDPRGVDYSRRSGDSSSVGGALSTIQLPAMPESSYASGTARRSGLLAGSVLSSGSASITSSPRNDATTLGSARSMETFDPEAFESANSTAFSAALTRADSGRSIGSDFSHGQFEDADSLAGSSHNPAAATANANASTPGRATRTPRGTSSFDSRGSVEF
ncbi:hypothetical protein BBJ28_00023603 [Nothophytophthora sp. Chile5]|nr:hypothetical protein BBJ28_00023603 [Nothophytophthora sp. Chile5]